MMRQKIVQTPIGIFDSGVGGLSILRHIRTQLPNESICYFSDSGFAPYGEKSEDEVSQRALFAREYLLEQGVKAIVVACNTATTAAIALLRAQYPELILVGVEPGLKPAASLTKTGTVGVLATGRTLASAKYQQLCEKIQQTTNVRFINQACPGLAKLIEQGELTTTTTHELIAQFLKPIVSTDADTIVLGCTHYHFVEDTIKRLANQESKHPIQLIDTGTAIANQLQRQLEKHELLTQPNANPSLQFATSGDINLLKSSLKQLLQLHPTDYQAQEISCNLSAG